MNKKLYLLLFSFSCPFLFGQAIDPSILSELSPEQIEMAKKAYSDAEGTLVPSDAEELSDVKESIEPKEVIDSNDTAGMKYGYGFFSTVPTSISAVGDLPLPNDYKISIRDQFTVILSGSKEAILDLRVKLDGTILFPEIGSISVVGETFGQVKEKLANLINQSYIGVQIDLSIKDLSAKKITIVGAVKTPGTYLVNPFSTISSSLAYSGGISEIGTLREIKLIRNTGEIFTFDLYKLLINGDRSEDITIEAGDTILINSASQFINLKGKVNRPAIYEVLDSENLDDLIKFGLGFQDISNKSKISILNLDLNNNTIYQEEIDDLSRSLNNIKEVTVFGYQSKVNANTFVYGAVSENGHYDIQEFPTLATLINALEFVDVYPWLAVLEQFDQDNFSASTQLFSLADPSTYESIKILPNSKVYFANLFNVDFGLDTMVEDDEVEDIEGILSTVSKKMIDDYSLTINHKSGKYVFPVYGRFSINSFVNLLGLDMSDVDETATYVSPLENKIVVENYKNMSFYANKYNAVSFKSKSNDLINVTISGSVQFPGTYTLNSNSTLEDLYKIIGDFKDTAFYDGVVFKRELVRDRQLKAIESAKKSLNESIIMNMQTQENTSIDPELLTALNIEIDSEDLGRISGNFSPNSDNIQDIILYDGDDIYVPTKSNSISVLGEVLNPNNFIFEKRLSIREAVDYAGGFKEIADERGIYIIRANGLVSKPSKNVFAGKNRYLEPGDTVIVPRKIIISNPISQTIAPITQILSDLAFSAAAIDNLSN